MSNLISDIIISSTKEIALDADIGFTQIMSMHAEDSNTHLTLLNSSNQILELQKKLCALNSKYKILIDKKNYHEEIVNKVKQINLESEIITNEYDGNDWRLLAYRKCLGLVIKRSLGKDRLSIELNRKPKFLDDQSNKKKKQLCCIMLLLDKNNNYILEKCLPLSIFHDVNQLVSILNCKKLFAEFIINLRKIALRE